MKGVNMMETTFSMIKPDATARNLIGAMLQKLESAGLKLVAGRLLIMEEALAKEFYKEHQERPFFSSLVSFIQSGPVFAMALKGEGAIAQLRELMGHTNPKDATHGTLRALYGENIERNSIHGSDSIESAKRELKLLFPELKE